MSKKLMDLMPEFKLIKDKELQKKTLMVWEAACKEGGWKIDELENIPFTLLIKDIKINIVMHTRSIVNCCLHTAKVMKETYGKLFKINHDHLIAGALLHDIGKLLEYVNEDGKVKKSYNGSLLRHPFSGVGLCYKYDIPPEIIHIVAVHSKEGDTSKRTPEAIILHHMDFVNFEPFLK
ncbi:HD domain-containing protein [bacterium]|nr:HD domain-containing protein [bacterium]